jgi:hypothetical protein
MDRGGLFLGSNQGWAWLSRARVAMAWATRWWSPVSITTSSMPS